MIIKEQLLADPLYNKKTAIEIASQATASGQVFDELMACFLSDNCRLAQLAAWSLNHAAKMKQELIVPYIKNLVEQLLRNDIHDAVVRNSIRILKDIDIPEEYHGEVMNACFLLAEKVETPIAIKAFALSTLYNLYLIYPDIKNELEAISEASLITESAAVKSVSRKILKALDKSKSPRINHQSAKVKEHRSKHRIAAGKQTDSAD